MAKSKSKKLELNNAKVIDDNGNFKIIERDEFDDSIEVEEYFPKEILNNFKTADRIKIVIKETKHRNMKTKEPKYTYKCHCDNKIKSKDDSLSIHCNKCNHDFEKVEE